MMVLFAFFIAALVGLSFRYYRVGELRKSLSENEVLVRPPYTALNFPKDGLVVNGTKVMIKQPQFDMPYYIAKIGDEIANDLPIYDQQSKTLLISPAQRGKEVILRHRNHTALVINLIILGSLIFGQEILERVDALYINYWLLAVVVSGLLQIALYFFSNRTVIELTDQNSERLATNS